MKILERFKMKRYYKSDQFMQLLAIFAMVVWLGLSLVTNNISSSLVSLGAIILISTNLRMFY